MNQPKERGVVGNDVPSKGKELETKMRGKCRLEMDCAFLLAVRGGVGRTLRKQDNMHPDGDGAQRQKEQNQMISTFRTDQNPRAPDPS